MEIIGGALVVIAAMSVAICGTLMAIYEQLTNINRNNRRKL